MMPHAARDPAQPDGLFEAFKGMAALAVDVAQTRLEPLSLEVEQERARLLALLVFSLVGAVFPALRSSSPPCDMLCCIRVSGFNTTDEFVRSFARDSVSVLLRVS
jgi:hypothetical protein